MHGCFGHCHELRDPYRICATDDQYFGVAFNNFGPPDSEAHLVLHDHFLVHRERVLERIARPERKSDRIVLNPRQLHLYAKLHRPRRLGNERCNADGHAATHSQYFRIAHCYRRRTDSDADVVVDGRHVLFGHGSVERIANAQWEHGSVAFAGRELRVHTELHGARGIRQQFCRAFCWQLFAASADSHGYGIPV